MYKQNLVMVLIILQIVYLQVLSVLVARSLVFESWEIFCFSGRNCNGSNDDGKVIFDIHSFVFAQHFNDQSRAFVLSKFMIKHHYGNRRLEINKDRQLSVAERPDRTNSSCRFKKKLLPT